MRCRWLAIVFAILYGLALLVYAAGSAAWPGTGADTLSGLFLVMLGLPWVLLLPDGDGALAAAAAALMPLANLAILMLVCRWRSRRPAPARRGET